MDQSEVLFTNRLVNFNVELVNFETNFANFGTKFGHFGKSFVKPTVINLQFRPSGWRLQFIWWERTFKTPMKIIFHFIDNLFLFSNFSLFDIININTLNLNVIGRVEFKTFLKSGQYQT
jgi:hypothetical protein